MNSKISVIIPVFNVKEYLQEAIDSIVIQKEFLHEIIIIDDGSTDGSGELLETLYSNIEFIKIVHKENQGQGLARNLGTDLSSSDFIFYFDSDDIAKPGLFKKFCTVLSKQPELEIFCFSGETFLDKNYSIEKVAYPSALSEKAYKRKIDADCNSGEEAYIVLKNHEAFFPLPFLYIFKKSILEKNGIKFRAIRYEDEEFTIQLFLYAGLTCITNDVYLSQRIRQGSTMQLNRDFKDIIGYIKTIETLIRLKNLTNLKTITKELLWNKILHLARAIITMKTTNKMKLTGEEKKIYKNLLKPLIWSDAKIFKLYYTYSLEYKLRIMKKKIFN